MLVLEELRALTLTLISKELLNQVLVVVVTVCSGLKLEQVIQELLDQRQTYQ